MFAKLAKWNWVVGFLVCNAAMALTTEDLEIVNLQQLQRGIKFTEEHRNIPLFDIGLAVLDAGFDGLFEEDGPNKIKPVAGVLPPGFQIVEDYTPYFETCASASPLAASSHGSESLKTVWAGTGNNPTARKMYALNANGRDAFICAVQYAVLVAKVKIIVYSNTYPTDGGFNGSGEMNEWVDWATSHGVLWFNAAGNSHELVYNGPIKNETLLRFRSNYASNPVNISVAWSGKPGSDRDLDFEIIAADKNKRAVSVTNYAQGPATEGDPRPKGSILAESANVTLQRNDPKDENDLYYIRVVKRGGNFNDDDTMQVTITPNRPLDGQPIVFLDKTGKQEVNSPGTSQNSITTADASPQSALGPTKDGRTKPELLSRTSAVQFANGDYVSGSTRANDLIAGGAMVVLGMAAQLNEPGREYRITRKDFLKFVDREETLSSPVRQPAQGSLPIDAQPVSMEALRTKHRYGDKIADAIERAAPTVVFEPYLLSDNSFVLASAQVKPPEVRAMFPTFNLQANQNYLDAYNYYVALQTDSFTPFSTWRRKTVEGGEYQERNPWDEYPGFVKSDFVEIRYVPMMESRVGTRTVKNFFKLPTKEELKSVLKQSL